MVTDEQKDSILDLVLGHVGEDVTEQFNKMMETFNDEDKAFMNGYLEGYADAFAAVERAQKDAKKPKKIKAKKDEK